MSKNWIAVASAEHVSLGRKSGFMQVCHGKAAPLRRLHPEDRVVYYSPTRQFRSKQKLQAFTALGIVNKSEAYQVEMAPGFCPFRRDVTWLEAQETSILPLLTTLEFTAGKQNWGYQMRFGLFLINDHDFGVIAQAMKVHIAGA